MKNKLPITEARSKLLKLPHLLRGGDYIDVTLREEPVLRIIRLVKPKAINTSDHVLLNLLEEAEQVPLPHRRPPQDLASHYKKYLYARPK